MPIDAPTWENSTDVPTWEDSRDETPTWDNSKDVSTTSTATTPAPHEPGPSVQEMRQGGLLPPEPSRPQESAPSLINQEANRVPFQGTYQTSPEQRQEEFKRAATAPIIPIKKFEINPDDSKAAAVGKSIVNFATGILEFAESPAGILTAPVAGIAPKIVASLFTLDMAHSLGEQATRAGLDWDNMTDSQKAAAVTDMSATGLMATVLGSGTGVKVASEIKTGYETAQKFTDTKTPIPVGFDVEAFNELNKLAPATAQATAETIKQTETPNAIRQQIASQEVLRQPQPNVELQGVGAPNVQSEIAPGTRTEISLTPEADKAATEITSSEPRTAPATEQLKTTAPPPTVEPDVPKTKSYEELDAEAMAANNALGPLFAAEKSATAELDKGEVTPAKQADRVKAVAQAREKLAAGLKDATEKLRLANEAEKSAPAVPEPVTPAAKPAETKAKPEPVRNRSSEFDRLIVEHGPELGWQGDYETLYAGQPEGGSTMAIEGKKRYSKALQALRRQAASQLNENGANLDSLSGRAAMLEKLKAHIEEQRAKSALPTLRPGEKKTGELFQGEDQPFNLTGEKGTDAERVAAEKAKREADAKASKEFEDEYQGDMFEEPVAEGDPFQTAEKDKTFERARSGEDSAFDDLDTQFREIYPDPIDFGRPGRTDPNTIHTPQAFAAMFNKAFAARDFDTILDAIKATSDVSVWKPFLQDLFKKQKTDALAAEKAEWMRHVFNGTVPPGAVPRPAPKPSAPRSPPPPVTPTPRPKAGATPPPKPPPTPPSPPPTRIPVDPIVGGGGKSPYRIIEDFSTAIGKAIRVLRMKPGGLGVYRPGSTLTAERFAGDLDTAAHELAGHWTDDKHGIGKPWIAPKTRSPYDSELAKFWIHGSVTPRSSLRYRRAEGIAEYVRAYVVNPTMAKAEAPTFSAYFEKTLPPEALKAIQDFSTDVRRWAGEEPLARAGLNIRMEPPTLKERLWRALTGKGFGFEINPIDRLRQQFDDPYHYAVKADKAIQELRGGGPRLPQEDFELTARLLATHDSRMSDQFENGLVPLRPGQVAGPSGKLEVERLIDPKTNRPMTMKWLLDPFDLKDKEAFQQDMRDTSAYMVAQRTLEKAKQLGRESNVSGIGAGIISDVQGAKELLAQVAKDPARQARLEEAARRYRLWADRNISMLVDAGRITKAQAKAIRDNNQQYVDMHRLSEEFDVANYQTRGGGIGTTKDVVRRFKGSSLELDNVYSNLLEQTDSIQKEAHRNVVMNNFVDGLRNIREMHGPELKDFDQFGRKVTSTDKNTITVYKNGKGEHWQFAPPVFESLKGLGELGTNALFSLVTLPSKFARYMITRGPSFMIRNPLRDTFERSVNTRSSGKPWDILQGYSKEELSRYEVFGGGQFGNYIVDRHVWNREIKQVMRELVKDPQNILLSPLKLKHAWEALGEKSEKLGRIAEFRRAFEAGKKRIATDHPTLTPQEVDYNAALYAAGEARGLLDFAKAGTVMKHINQAIPFSNASMRGLGKSIQGIKENPGRYAMNWGLYVLAPTLAVMAWNRSNPETWKEYQQLPAYRRDLFWNIKVGNHWLIFPKPHLLGVLAGGVERIVNAILGDKHPMEGVASSASSALPLNSFAEASGPLKTFLELNMNRDTFRNRDIVPAWEKDLNLELRKGTAHASAAGRGIASAMNVSGLGIDPRQVDHVLNSMGGVGSATTGLTSPNRDLGEGALRATGLFTETPGTNAKDVQWVLDWARKNGKMQSIDGLLNARKAVFNAKTSDERNAARKRVRELGTELRYSIESRH